METQACFQIHLDHFIVFNQEKETPTPPFNLILLITLGENSVTVSRLYPREGFNDRATTLRTRLRRDNYPGGRDKRLGQFWARGGRFPDRLQVGLGRDKQNRGVETTIPEWSVQG